MMRIKMKNGSISGVVKVSPLVERRDKFNGKIDSRVAITNGASENISGLLFHMDGGGTGIFGTFPNCNDVVVGNLPKTEVNKILDSLLTQGYADLSVYSYQKEGTCYYDTVYDGGKSEPYFLTDVAAVLGLNACGFAPNPFASNPFKMSCDPTRYEDDTDHYDTSDAETLRAEIYENTDDYTISELAGMEKDALIDVLKSIRE